MKFFAIVLTALAGVMLCSAPLPERNAVVASVNGSAITLYDLLPETERQEKSLAAAWKGKDLEREIYQLRRKTLDQMIDTKLLLEAYEKAEFRVQDQEIERILDDFAESAGIRSRRELEAHLRAAGMAELRRKASERLRIQVMLARKMKIAVNITPKEVWEEYQKNRESLGEPERLTLSLLLIKPDTPASSFPGAAVIGAEIQKNPALFAEFARRYSAGAAAEKGGALGQIPRPALRPEFAAILGTAPEAGKVYGPFALDGGEAWLKVDEISPAVIPSYTEAAPALRRKLEDTAREEAVKAYLKQLRADAAVEIFLEE